MRQIMVDALSEASMILVEPDSESRVVRIPEPDSSNEGPTGLQGSGDYVRSKQSMELEITRSGQFIGDIENGALCEINLDGLYDNTDPTDPIVEGDIISLGASRHVTPGPIFVLDKEDSDYFYSPGIVPLEKWRESSYVEAVMLYIKSDGVSASGTSHHIYHAEMSTSYVWDATPSLISDISFDTTSSIPPKSDGVELEDGTILIVTMYSDDFVVYRSFDGPSFNKVEHVHTTSGIISTPGSWGDICVERIGNTLVCCYVDWSGTPKIYSMISNDNGYTWSTPVAVITGGSGFDDSRVHLVVGQNGKLYLAYVAASVGTNATYIVSTLDGVNWDTSSPASLNDSLASERLDVALVQEPSGMWAAYQLLEDYTNAYAGVIDIRLCGDADPHAYGTWDWWYDNELGDHMVDTDGAEGTWLTAKTLNRGAFTDIVVTYEDTHSGTNKGSIVVFRVARWDSHQPWEDDNGSKISITSDRWYSWAHHAYPSTSDGHPNLNHWTRTLTGGSSVSMGSTSVGLIVTGNGGHAYYQTNSPYNYNYTTGVTVRCNVNSGGPTPWGIHKVEVFLSDNGGTNLECNWEVQWDFTNGTVTLYDLLATTNRDQITPSNWNIDDEADYIIIGMGQKVNVYRIPFDEYEEFCPAELILTTDAMSTQAYSAASYIRWGSIDRAPTGVGDNKGFWKWFHYRWMANLTTDSSEVDISTSDDRVGRKCPTIESIGLYQGIYARFYGDHALEGDKWTVETGAVYDPHNIFVHSPGIQWREPEQATSSPERKFEWRREDEDGNEMIFEFNAFAIFGLTSPVIKLYGLNFDGSGGTLLLDVPASTSSGPQIYKGTMKVGAINNNIITCVKNTSNWDGEFIPNQFASNNFRKWYVWFTSGSKSGFQYKVLANSDDDLHLDVDVETAGVSVNDEFIIHTDRFFHKFDSMKYYSRLRLLLNNGVTIYVHGRQTRIGTVLLGKTYNFPDDEWTSLISTEPQINTVEGRGGRINYREIGQEKRNISISYTGITDKGMGVDQIRKIYEYCRWGVHPLVWIDHDSGMVQFTSPSTIDMSHIDPILAKVKGPLQQERQAYRYLYEDEIYFIRNINNLSGIVLEEVL